MTTNYPGALDTTTQLKNDAVDATVTATTHKTTHNNVADAIIAIETTLGTSPSSSFSDVVARLAGMIILAPSADQQIQPTSDYIALGIRNHATQTVVPFQVQDSAGTPVLTWDKLANIDLDSMKVGGAALASTHLADTANILLDPSPSITTPTISSPTLTGVPTAPTPSTADNSTKVATTAFVINQAYAKPASPTFTGTPTAPTQSVADDSTKIATTAYVIAQIDNMQASGIPIGAVTLWTGATPPTDWLVCDGSAVSRTTYSELYTVQGNSYGAGNGSTTFNLPDLQGRFAVGKGTHVDVDALGENDGQTTVASRTPKHVHSHSISGDNQGGHTHSGSLASTGSHSHGTTGTTSFGGGTGACPCASNTAGVTTSSDGSHSHGGSTGGEGTGNHSLSGSVGTAGALQDSISFLTSYYIIKAL